MPKIKNATCSTCSTVSCNRRDKAFPAFCLTTSVPADVLLEATEICRGDGIDARIARAAAEVEGTFYGRLTRAEEIVAFANRIGAKKIGIATCLGLIQESRTFAKVLDAKGLESCAIVCKVGSVDKTEIGIPEEMKVQRGCHESMCNPVLQAKLLNERVTDLNVIVGLCVGHDSLFIRHSQAPVTTLVTKDRVLAHNPVAALYTTGSYYKRLLATDRL